MAKIPVKDVLKHAIDHPQIVEFPRDYLGMSQIGEPCDRYLQYYFRWVDTITLDRRINRLFNFGHIAEEQIRTELRRIGCQFNHQQLEIIGFAGHWKGHIDGTVCEVPDHPGNWLIEYKTHNEKWFKHLKKNGVQKGFLKHYDQCQRYMTEMPFDGCMYIGYNKNDSDYLIEFIPHDESRQTELKRKEQHIMLEGQISQRIGTGQINWHECRFCDFKNVCFDRKPIMKNCRTCKHIAIQENGIFSCIHPDLEWQIDRHSKTLNIDEQKEGCGAYELDEEFFGD